jgi:hypothetical protein
VAEPGNPIAWNRYAYVYSAPVHYTDSSGHFIDTLWDVFDLAADALNCLGDSDTLACYMLVPDALALALPFVPGVVDNALKATKHADMVWYADEATVVVPGSDDIGQTARLLRTQSEVAEIIAPHLDAIRRLDPNAQVGFRGGLARGKKGPHKKYAPFDPADFDVDAFIISDELANRFSRREWFRSGSRIPEIQNIQQQIDRVLRERFPGLRDEEFTFRVWKTQEFFRKVGPDERFFISR